jgi:hypothetical protein
VGYLGYFQLNYQHTFCNCVSLVIDFLIDGQISSFCPDKHEAKLLTLIMLHKLTQTLRKTLFRLAKGTLAVILFGPGGHFMSKMPMFQRAEMWEGGLPLPPAFQYFIVVM